jgi:transposase-like protein
MDLPPCSAGVHRFSAHQGFHCAGCGFEYHYDDGVNGTPV